MVVSIGWFALTLIWCSGLLAGRAVAAFYAGSATGMTYAIVAFLLLLGIALHITHKPGSATGREE